MLQVRKQSGTNTIEVIDRVKDRMEALRTQLPKGWNMTVVRDQSEYIEAAVHAVQEHLVLGALFAAAIVFLFLKKFRLTLISAVAIPTSLIATFATSAWAFRRSVIVMASTATGSGAARTSRRFDGRSR